jgi:hypothetical protein
MRNITSVDPADLFTPGVVTDSGATVPEGSSSGVLANEFLKWCWGVAEDFHNSPDITNLQYWLEKKNEKLAGSEQNTVLVEARRLYLKKLEQAVRKVDVPKVAD